MKYRIIIISLIILSIYMPGNAVNKYKFVDEYKPMKNSFTWVKKDFYFHLQNTCKKYNIDPLFALSIAQAESGGRNVVSKRNKNGTRDFGIFQINSVHLPKTPYQLLDYKINTNKAMSILRECLKKAKGDKRLACAYYNAGTNCNVKKYFQQRSAYPNKILKKYYSVKGSNLFM